jgi:hypothetical protein
MNPGIYPTHMLTTACGIGLTGGRARHVCIGSMSSFENARDDISLSSQAQHLKALWVPMAERSGHFNFVRWQVRRRAS